MADTRSSDMRAARARETAEATIAGVELPKQNSAVVIGRSGADAALRESEVRFRELADNISQFA